MADACCGPVAVQDGASPDALDRWKTIAAAVSAIAWTAAIFLGALGVGGSTLAFSVALVVGGATFAPGAATDLARGRIGISLLMTIAAVGAVLLGELGEAATLAFLFSISEALEEWAFARSRRGLSAVLSLIPDTTRVRRDDGDHEIPTDRVEVGDLVVVRAGERVAIDGLLVDGHSSLDLSAVTGESIPEDCAPGDPIVAGAVNGGGLLLVEVTATVSNSTLTRIVRAVEDARDRKGSAQRLADRIATPLVPGILVVAGLIALVGSAAGDPDLWIERALVVLVAASPCAFAISVPVTVFAAVGAATRAGLVVKGGAALEGLATVRTVALDKTGTLTRNEPVVIETVPTEGNDADTIIALAAALEAHSDHPLAAAIMAIAPEPLVAAADVRTIAGCGVVARVDGAAVRVGKPGFIEAGALGADVARLHATGATVVLVDRDERTIGAIGIRDELRPEAANVVARLSNEQRLHVVLLSGDNQPTVTSIGRLAGIDDARGALLPEDKTRAVTELQSRGPVAMIGDGINDAPALATADVGIAIGAGGTDVAVEAADIAIMGHGLTHVPDVVALARRTRRLMLQNLVLSGLIIAALIPAAALGALGLGVVVATHELAEIVVIANGLRAGRTITGHPSQQVLALPNDIDAATV